MPSCAPAAGLDVAKADVAGADVARPDAAGPDTAATDPQVELELTALAYGGEALGRGADGRVVFVPFALPGERVRAQLVERRKRWARGRLVELLQPSSERIEPRCRHYAVCGGCHYQHLPYSQQLGAKQSIVREQLQRLGGLADPPVEPTIPSPTPWGYRNQLQFHLDPAGRLGFIAHAQTGDWLGVIPIQECHLPTAALAALWPQIELEGMPGLERIALRSGPDGQAMLIFHAQGPPLVALELDLPVSVVWLWPDGMQVLAGSSDLWMQAGGRSFRVSAPSFFQVNDGLTHELVQLALQGLAAQPGQLVYDLYAGVGLFSAFIADTGARLVAVEQSAWACEDFQHNLQSLDGVALYEADVEQALPGLSGDPDAVLVDPPRAGLSEAVVDGLITRKPARLVYVSCDPATLARDARRLTAGGFRLERAVPVDLFPQTYHIEAVTHWQR